MISVQFAREKWFSRSERSKQME